MHFEIRQCFNNRFLIEKAKEIDEKTGIKLENNQKFSKDKIKNLFMEKN